MTLHPAVSNGAYDVARVRQDFPALAMKVYGKPLVYLDNAASAQKPLAVLDRMTEAYRSEYANVHRGLHYLANAATEAYEGGRAKVAKFLNEARASEGALTLFIRHTSASLTIQENADPSVLVDLTTALSRLAPENVPWTHDTEGPDDMPAHVKTMLTQTSLQVPVLGGELALGTWQAIYLIEHRARPHRREIVLQFIGSNK